MKITIDNTVYETVYYPFFRTDVCDDFAVYTIRYPSGTTEEMIVFDQSSYVAELKEHLVFLLSQYGLEEDDMLTPRAKELKADVKALFGID